MEIQENVALGVQNRSEASPVHTFHFFQPPTAASKSTDPTSRKASQVPEQFSRSSFGASVFSAPSRAAPHSAPEQASVTAELWHTQEKEGGAVAVWRQNQPVITDRMDIVQARPHMIHLYHTLCQDFGSPVDPRIEFAINDASADIPEAGLGALNLRSAHLQYNKPSGAPPLPEDSRRVARDRAARAVKVGDMHILPLLEVLSHAMPHAPVHTLDLSYSEISDVSVKALATWLAHTDTLTVLNLEGNYITAKGAELLAQALPTQRSLRQLSLSRNPLGVAGVSALSDALMGNDTLVSLDLADTDAGAVGCMRVAALLQSPTLPLVRLNLDGACAPDEAASVTPHLARALIHSRLQALSVAKWGLRCEQVQWLAQSLQQNRSLTEINLRANAVDSTGTAILAMAMRLRRDACFVNLDSNPLRDQLLDEVYSVCDAEVNDEALDHFSTVADRPAFACLCEFSTGEPLDEELVDRYSDMRHCLISRVAE
jgi:Ran GTPase-activating protein (RanGAP) involved in mRNA processing and transport